MPTPVCPFPTPPFAIELVEPGYAHELYLACKKRGVNWNVVYAMIAEIMAGTFLYNGQDILIGPDGVMGDGMHRCLAIYMSGIAVWWGVKREIIPLNSVDGGRSRGPKDYLKMDGVENPNRVAAAARIVMNILGGKNVKHTPLRREVLDWVGTNPGIVTSVSQCMAAAKIVPVAALSAVTHLATRKGLHQDKLASFIDGIAHGENLNAGDPTHTIREWVMTSKFSGVNLRSEHYVDNLMKAFSSHVNGTKLFRFGTAIIDPAIFDVVPTVVTPIRKLKAA